MGDDNQIRFVERYQGELEGPFLEVGSRDYGSTFDFREMFRGRGEFLGIDMSEGKGVDRVLDLTASFDAIERELNGRRFGTILCLSVLEHCENPFQMATNLTRLLRPGGKAVISVPFAWRFHGYPSDYWRFTHEGVRKLFPDLEFDLESKGVASVSGADFEPLDESIGLLPFSFQENWSKGRKMRAVSSKVIKVLAKAGPLRWLARRPYVLAPTMISMVGTKKN